MDYDIPFCSGHIFLYHDLTMFCGTGELLDWKNRLIPTYLGVPTSNRLGEKVSYK